MIDDEGTDSQMTTAIAPISAAQSNVSIYANDSVFESAQRIAKALSASTIVPDAYRNNLPNCLVALEMAQRMAMSPLMVMQNLKIIQGSPSWSSAFIIGVLNSSGLFSTRLDWAVNGTGDGKKCVCWAIERGTGQRLEGPEVSIQMAKDEGWYSRNGSKWKTLSELMLRYRSAAFFGRLYAPELLIGLKTEDELRDFIDVTPNVGRTTIDKLAEIKDKLNKQSTAE